jgi:carboxymethylenebutenolidase
MTEAVQTSWISVTGSAGTYDAYLALPPARKGPGLLLLQEIFGVNEHIRGVAEQYASDGFVVMAPDVFWQQQRRVELGYVGAQRERGIELATKADPAGLLRDLLDSLATLRSRPEVAGHKIGVFGYCMGGRLAYLTAAHSDVDAAVAFYGGGIQTQLDLAQKIRCPTLFHYGEIDANIPLEAVERVRAAMAGTPCEVHVYPGAHHGFNCWARDSYDPASAALARGRTLEFFATQLF